MPSLKNAPSNANATIEVRLIGSRPQEVFHIRLFSHRPIVNQLVSFANTKYGGVVEAVEFVYRDQWMNEEGREWMTARDYQIFDGSTIDVRFYFPAHLRHAPML